ncbi:MAG: hypothetical protein II710_00970, partial [Clostridia bacterium]|nr:hypothetical protein [Clostridia bacterium]
QVLFFKKRAKKRASEKNSGFFLQKCRYYDILSRPNRFKLHVVELGFRLKPPTASLQPCF